MIRGQGPVGERQGGVVKSYDDATGYGFITPDDGSEDVFLPVSVMRTAGHVRLYRGTRVKFIARSTSRGVRAVWIDAGPARRRPAQNEDATSPKSGCW